MGRDIDSEMEFNRKNFDTLIDQSFHLQEHLIMQRRLNDVYRAFIMGLILRLGGDQTQEKREYVHNVNTYKLVEMIKLDGEEGNIRMKVELK